jgi:hypothetical protein
MSGDTAIFQRTLSMATPVFGCLGVYTHTRIGGQAHAQRRYPCPRPSHTSCVRKSRTAASLPFTNNWVLRLEDLGLVKKGSFLHCKLDKLNLDLSLEDSVLDKNNRWHRFKFALLLHLLAWESLGWSAVNMNLASLDKVLDFALPSAD